MKVLSLYCGAGGIDEGLKQAGIKTTIAIDAWKDACVTIKENHPDCEVINGKVSDYIESLNSADIVVGGPPCPPFSKANINRSMDICEVNNFWSVVMKTNPKYYLMENVTDIVKVLKRRNFLLNAADYGVPQTRQRRFYTNLPEPKPTHSKNPSNDLFGNNLKKWVSVREALNLKDGYMQDRKITFGSDEYREYSIDKPSNTIHTDSRQWYISSYGHKKQNRDCITRSIDEPSDTVVVANGMRITDFEIKSQKKIKHRKEIKGFERKLENKELAILQGFPTTYKFIGSISSVKRQIGNAVPPPMITAVFKQIFEKENNLVITN